MRAFGWIVAVALLLAAGSAAVHMLAGPVHSWEPVHGAWLVGLLLVAGLGSIPALVMRRPARWGWPVVLALPALVVLLSTWLTSDGRTMSRVALAEEGIDALWATVAETFAWLALARAAGSRADERPPVGLVLRETASRWPDGAVVLGGVGLLVLIGAQVVIPGVIAALLFAQVATVLVYEADGKPLSGAVNAFVRAPLQVSALLVGLSLAGGLLGWGAVAAIYGWEAMTSAVVGVPVSPWHRFVGHWGWYLGVGAMQWLLVGAWRSPAAVAPLEALGEAAAENPWAAG